MAKIDTCYWAAALMLSFGTATRLHAASAIQFSTSSYSAPERDGFVALPVQRSGETNRVVDVDLATVDGTPTNGFKYMAVSGRLTFEVGEAEQPI